MSEPRVTLMVPTYKRPELLEQCLASIQRQTFEDFVVLVCDNSSDREAEPVVAALNDPKFSYVPRPQNLGILGNALQGFADSRTPWVMEVDDDDILYPHCLESLMQPLLEDPSLALSFGDLNVIDSDGNKLPDHLQLNFIRSDRGITPGLQRSFESIAIRGLIFMVAAIVRKDAVDWLRVPLTAGPAYDRFIGISASCGGRAAFYVKEPLVGYRVHPTADGIAFEERQIAGTLNALAAAEGDVNGEARRVLREEMLRQYLLWMRVQAAKAGAREALPIARELVTSGSWRGFGDLIGTSYCRHGSIAGLARGVAFRKRRRRASLLK